ncbi:MAG TPA: hypothetical protein VMT77_05485 [Gemmatimonadales bacterium]|nr:hypothetical protein [Gemmatimonadales bacterium]
MSLNKIGMLLLSIWFIFAGLRGLFGLGYSHFNLLMNLLAIVGGALVLWSLVQGRGEPKS